MGWKWKKIDVGKIFFTTSQSCDIKRNELIDAVVFVWELERANMNECVRYEITDYRKV